MSHSLTDPDLLALLSDTLNGAADGGVRFAGPVLPQAAQIPRLLKSLGL